MLETDIRKVSSFQFTVVELYMAESAIMMFVIRCFIAQMLLEPLEL